MDLKANLTESLFDLRDYPRIQRLYTHLKKSSIIIPNQDYSNVVGMIIQVVQEIPDIMQDMNSLALRELLLNCASQPDAIDQLRILFKNKPEILNQLLAILEEYLKTKSKDELKKKTTRGRS